MQAAWNKIIKLITHTGRTHISLKHTALVWPCIAFIDINCNGTNCNVSNKLVILPSRGLLPGVDLPPDGDILKPEDVGDAGGVPDHEVLGDLPPFHPRVERGED